MLAESSAVMAKGLPQSPEKVPVLHAGGVVPGSHEKEAIALRSYSVRERLAGVPSGLAGWFKSVRALEPLRYTVMVPGSGPARADVMV